MRALVTTIVLAILGALLVLAVCILQELLVLRRILVDVAMLLRLLEHVATHKGAMMPPRHRGGAEGARHTNRP